MLAELIEWLRKQPPEKIVSHGFAEPNSYRGYYEDVAFEPAHNASFGSMLAYAESALGRTFEGYKGGEFVMDKGTRCWIAAWGCVSDDMIGPLIMSLWEAAARWPDDRGEEAA